MRLAWDMAGAGSRRVMALHGFTGHPRTWDRVQEFLPELTFVRVALPGHGESPDAPPGQRGFAETIEALRHVADEHQPEAILGYSLGARLALALAIEHPRCVPRLVLESGTPGLADSIERAARHERDEALAASLLRQGIEAFVDRWEQQPVLAGLTRLPSSERAVLRAQRLDCRPEGLAASLRSVGAGVQPDYRARFAGVTAPTLLLSGELDAAYGALAAEMAKQLPRAVHRTIAGSGHTPHLEAPEAIARELSAFLQAGEAARDPLRGDRNETQVEPGQEERRHRL